jgi:hypothetical protein
MDGSATIDGNEFLFNTVTKGFLGSVISWYLLRLVTINKTFLTLRRSGRNGVVLIY